MSLVLSQEQELLRDSARNFVERQWKMNTLRKKRMTPNAPEFSAELWRQMTELGWTAIPFAEQYGGIGLGYAELGIVFEELGRKLVTSPLLSSVVLGGAAIDLAGSDSQKSLHLPKICSGENLYTLGYQESARHDPYNVRTTLEPHGNRYKLHGKKLLVLDGGTADTLVVLARSSGNPCDREGLSLAVLNADREGVSIRRNLLIDGNSASTLTFDEVAISEDEILGTPGGAADALDAVFQRAAAALSADMLGGIQAALDMTLDYLRTREQFGAKIGSFQGLKHRAARWFCESELSRSIVLEALRAIDEERLDAPRIISACKARTSDTYQLSGKEGIQMHGGIGVTDEHDIGLYFKRARVTEMLFGDSSFHTEQFAAVSGY